MRRTCRHFQFAVVAATAALALATSVTARAQDAAAAAPGPQFAPGVVTTIDPIVDRVDTLSVHDIVELRANPKLEWKPSKWLKWESATPAPTNRTLYEMAKGAAFPQHVWCLEFSFKPLRMIEVDVPQDDGRAQRKQIWYMVYRVRNTGAGMDGEVQPDGSFNTKEGGVAKVRFIPQFVLASHERPAAPGATAAARKAYLDRLVPTAMAAIRQRELPRGQLFNSVDISEQELAIESGRTERGLWGVAMWEDVDPEIDFFSVYVGGLTNAYKWVDPQGAYQAGDPPGTGRKLAHRTLQLNFWRPGDSLEPNEREIRFGVAPGDASLYAAGEGVAYQWVYR